MSKGGLVTEVVVYDPVSVPIQGFRSFMFPSHLQPGEYQDIYDCRWDTGVFTVRNGTTSLGVTPPSGGVPIDYFCGSLNGTVWVVAAWIVASKIGLFTWQPGATVWTEVTSTAGFAGPGGNSRFPTVTSFVNFAVVHTPNRVIGGAASPGSDVLIIQNGADYPRIWDPKQNPATGPLVSIQAPITVPPLASGFTQAAGFSTFFEMVGFSIDGSVLGPPAINETGHIVPTTNPSTTVGLTVGTSVATNDVATFSPTNAPVAFLGTQLIMFVDESYAQVLGGCKIDVSPSAGSYGSRTWYPLYDPTSTNAELSSYEVETVDLINGQYLIIFDISALVTAARSIRWMRFTWTATSAPTSPINMNIHGVFGATPANTGLFAGYPGGTNWGLAYSDSYSRAESYGIVDSGNTGVSLNQVGGPPFIVLDSGGQEAPPPIPVLETIFYDYALSFANSTNASTLVGGLLVTNTGTSEPVWADIYCQLPGSTAFYYWQSFSIYGAVTGLPGNGWAKTDTTDTIITEYTNSVQTSQNFLDPVRPLPSSYQVVTPIAQCMLSANKRLFVGNVLNEFISVPTDVYFSGDLQPFRFQSIVENDDSGSRVSFAGQTVMAFFTLSAAYFGATYIYVITDQQLNVLGGDGGSAGSGYTASLLSTASRIGPYGTLCPRSVAVGRDTAFWLDQFMDVRRYSGGIPENISRLSVYDRFLSLPVGRQPYTRGLWHGERYYLGYTPAGAATNTHMLVWHDVLQKWESDDRPPIQAQLLGNVYNANIVGSGQQLLMLDPVAYGLYSYETGTTDLGSNINAQITFREISPDRSGTAVLLDSVETIVDPGYTTMTVNRYYRAPQSVYQTTLDITTAGAIGNGGWVTDENERKTVVQAASPDQGELGSAVYADVLINAPGGTRMLRMIWNLRQPGSSNAYPAY